MRHSLFYAFTLTACIASSAFAGDRQVDYNRIMKDNASSRSVSVTTRNINYDAMHAQGFGGVADLLESMTPDQRRQVLELAAQRQKELKAMSPSERRKLEAQLKEVTLMIDSDMGFENIDPAKLDPAKAKNMRETRADLETYQRERVN